MTSATSIITTLTLLMLILSSLSIIGLSPIVAGEDGLIIVVTFASLANDLQPLLAPGDKLYSITPPGIDPHEYQLTPNDIELLRSADIIVSTGHAPFEIEIRKLVSSGEIKATLIEIPSIEGIKILNNPVTNTPNYHMIIYDPVNYKIFIEEIAEAMARKNPSYKDYYEDKARTIVSEINALLSYSNCLDVRAVSDTPMTQYAVSWLGIKITHLLVKEHGVAATPGDIEEIKKALQNNEVDIVVVTSPESLSATKHLIELAKEYQKPVLYVPSPLVQKSILEKLHDIVSQVKNLTIGLSKTSFTQFEEDNAYSNNIIMIMASTIIASLAIIVILYMLRRRGV